VKTSSFKIDNCLPLYLTIVVYGLSFFTFDNINRAYYNSPDIVDHVERIFILFGGSLQYLSDFFLSLGVNSTNTKNGTYTWPDLLYWPFVPFMYLGIDNAALSYKLFLTFLVLLILCLINPVQRAGASALFGTPVFVQQISSMTLDSLMLFGVVVFVFRPRSELSLLISIWVKPYTAALIYPSIKSMNRTSIISFLSISLAIVGYSVYRNKLYYSNTSLNVGNVFLHDLLNYIINIGYYSHFWIRQVYGVLSYNLKTILPIPLYVTFFSLWGYACYRSRSILFNREMKITYILFFGMLLGSFFFILPSGIGFQGRYVLPIMIYVASLFNSDSLKSLNGICALNIVAQLYMVKIF